MQERSSQPVACICQGALTVLPLKKKAAVPDKDGKHSGLQMDSNTKRQNRYLPMYGER